MKKCLDDIIETWPEEAAALKGTAGISSEAAASGDIHETRSVTHNLSKVAELQNRYEVDIS
ncbi:unnamed protein product [Protopolystoma xenopodis]|uniref:Uncharacterized protein n=1 Tax=Protopolystoma xenopodis TaxID=117903 RepID=A0A448X6I4_9PLAT|nr:unnamed protein product [Protopolystoma xenopodis]